MSWGYSSGPIAENPLKKREDALWSEFANTGVMPAVPVLNDQSEVQRARTILEGDYNQLQKVLDGEALARMGLLSAVEANVQVVAAGWVLKMINSAKRAYPNKEAMAKAFLAFKAASSNKRMVLACGLDKGAAMLKEAEEPQKVLLAEKFLTRLSELASDDEQNARLEEFISLSISVGWTFAKADKYDALAQVLSLLPIDAESDYFQKNISALHDKMRFAEEKPLRDWMARVKNVLASEPVADVVHPLLVELQPLVGVGAWYDGPVHMKDGGMFESRQIVFLRLCQLAKIFKNGLPIPAAQAILQIFKQDGLQNLSHLFYERRDKDLKSGETLQPQAKPYWPALSEDMAKLIANCCKVCYGRKEQDVSSSIPNLDWVISFLDEVYSRYTDDEWSDFRIGKVLVWAKKIDRAKERLLPIIRKKQSEYWVWELLGDLMPDKRECCLVRALSCHADEKYTKALRQEAEHLGLDKLSTESRDALIAEADELLIVGLEAHHGILIDRFKTKEGKKRLLFSTGDGTEIVPVSEKMARLYDLRVGMPVDLYWNDENERPVRLIAVRPRNDGEDWDVLTSSRAVYLGSLQESSGSVAGIYADEKGVEFLSRIPAGPFSPGDAVDVFYKDVAKGKHRECVRIVAAPSIASGYSILPQADVVYYGLSQKGTSYQFTSGYVEMNVLVDKFPKIGPISPGDAFRVAYSSRICEDKILHTTKKLLNIQFVERIDSASDVIETFVGRLRLPKGLNGPGFAGGIYIPTGLLVALLSDGVQSNVELFVKGRAVRLPSKTKVDKYGIPHTKPMWRAIEVERIDDPVEIQRMLDEEASEMVEESEF